MPDFLKALVKRTPVPVPKAKPTAVVSSADAVQPQRTRERSPPQPQSERTQRKRYYWWDDSGKRHRTVATNTLSTKSECASKARAKLASNVSAGLKRKFNAIGSEITESAFTATKLRLSGLMKSAQTKKFLRQLRNQGVVLNKGSRFSASALCDMGLAKEFSTAAKAGFYNCAKITVLRSMRAAAHDMLVLQEATCRKFMEKWNAIGPLNGSVIALADSTSERLAMWVNGHRIRPTFHLYVMVNYLSWTDQDGSHCMKLVCPPIPCTATKASDSWNAEQNHPWSRPIARCISTFKSKVQGVAWDLPCEDSPHKLRG